MVMDYCAGTVYSNGANKVITKMADAFTHLKNCVLFECQESDISY
jgi:hypothetical protein